MTSMEIHARVYIAADMLDIARLKTFSAERFLTSLRQCKLVLGSPQFPTILKAVYENTNGNDLPMRLPTTLFLIQKHGGVKNHSEIMDIINEHELILWKAGTSLMEEKEKVVKECNILRSTKHLLESDLEQECPGNDEVPYEVRLDEPIGQRQLLDGSCRSGGEAASTSFCAAGAARWVP